MATTTTTDRRVAIGLDLIRRALDDLSDVAQDWLGMDDGERASWSLDWDHLMGTYLRLIAQCDRAGSLSTEQHEQYRALQMRLAEARPTIERLQLYTPPVDP